MQVAKKVNLFFKVYAIVFLIKKKTQKNEIAFFTLDFEKLREDT